MAVQSTRQQSPAAALEAFAAAGRAIADGTALNPVLRAVAEAAAQATDAIALVRVLDRERAELATRAVGGPAALVAELEGTRVAAAEVTGRSFEDLDGAPTAIRQAARRVGAKAAYVVPVTVDERVIATVEILAGSEIGADEQVAASVAAAQVALALRAFGFDGVARGSVPTAAALELVGNALVAGGRGAQAGEEVARLAVLATDATAAVIWEWHGDDDLALAAAYGLPEPAPDLAELRALAEEALLEPSPELEAAAVEPLPDARALTFTLGEPPLGVLQLLFTAGAAPAQSEIGAIGTFAVRAASALRGASEVHGLADELERTRALLGVVAQATAELSLSHTLATAVERVAELLGVEQLVVYLRERDRLLPAAGRGLAGPHVRVAERLLELALGPLRTRGVIAVDDVAAEPLLAGVAGAAAEAGIARLVAVPLTTQEETIGLLVVYPSRRRSLGESEIALLVPLASQLAVAVQNAQLHERAKELSEERMAALAAEQQAARRLRALYEISRSFTQSLSLDATLEAVARTAVEILDVDAAVIQMPDERRELLLARATHVADASLADAAEIVLAHPQPFGAQPIQRLFRNAEAFRLDASMRGELAAALGSFLSRGWTVAVVPVATPGEVIAALTIASFRSEVPIGDVTIEAAAAIGAQAALAIDNARLYQQQKQFADTMQRSLLPRSQPKLAGLEVGDAYESAARVEVGGDVYDFLELPDGRLAVVLGDVTGHGIEATADMAMAKFVFRSLAREHSEPADFLAAANDVVVDEIAPAKFITMAYLTVDGATGDVATANAGHPPARLLRADATVEGLDATGIVLGVDAGQHYEEMHASVPVGGAIVLYTDGVIEARRDGELYGIERLDALLSEHRALPARDLAHAVVEDCRAFAGGELSDDCAVVVIKRI
jgi:serine phosphatase RsbU (regulator of sigma subunit)/PAS domain-containing protein